MIPTLRLLALAVCALALIACGGDTDETPEPTDTSDAVSSPLKAKGVGELGLCGVAAAVANAVYNATGLRIRDYPVTLDKMIDRLPAV